MDKLEALLSKYESTDRPKEPEKGKYPILVVDDDESMRRGLDRSLSSQYHVITAENGEMAIQKFGTDTFYTVILDVKMPGMSGFEVCKELNKINPEIPIIFFTAFQGEHDLQAILNIYRPFAYLDKGGEYDLTDVVNEAVAKYAKYIERINYQKELEAKIIKSPADRKDNEIDFLFNIRNLIDNNNIEHSESNQIRIFDFNTEEILGYMPDLSDEQIQDAISACHDKLDRWRRLTVLERLEIIKAAGQKLRSNAQFDAIISRSGWFSRKISVTPDRDLTANWMLKSVEYMKWAFGEERIEEDYVEGIGTVGIIIQSSMFQTGAYGIVEALRAGNSVLVKLDSRDPYPEYLIAKTLADEGAPVQIVSVDTRKKPHIGRKLIDGLDKIVFMGNPFKIVEIAYGEALQQLNSGGGITQEGMEALKDKLLIPAKVISYTAHLGGAYIHSDADLDDAVTKCVYSSISHYRSCKRLKAVTVHPDVYDTFANRVSSQYEELKLGKTTDPEADVVFPNNMMLSKVIRPYLDQSNHFSRILVGDTDGRKPTIIEIAAENLVKNDGIGSFIGHEAMFPHIILIKGDENIAILATRLMAENSHDGMILEYSVFASDIRVFRFIEKYGYSFNYHFNEPTTWGLGNPAKDKFRFHQRRILSMDLAGTRVG